MRLTGKITRWFPAGYGYAVMRQGPRMIRAFLHCSKIISLPENLDEPIPGCTVSGELTNDFKRSYKDSPSLIDAEVGPAPVVDLTALRVLAGKHDVGGAE